MELETFGSIDASDSAPSAICKSCAQQSLEHVATHSIFCYCSHTKTGAMCGPRQAWIEAPDISAEAFNRAVLLSVLEGEQRALDLIDGEQRH